MGERPVPRTVWPRGGLAATFVAMQTTGAVEAAIAGLSVGIDHDLLTLYYGELRQIARRAMRGGERITFQPTDLVNAAALRLLESKGVWIRDETHLLALAARVIRLTFIDEVRRRAAGKRDVAMVTAWDEHDAPAELDILRFDELLEELAEFEPDGARVVEMRFYVGMSMKEISDALAVSERTIHRRWASARAWLLKELQAA